MRIVVHVAIILETDFWPPTFERSRREFIFVCDVALLTLLLSDDPVDGAGGGGACLLLPPVGRLIKLLEVLMEPLFKPLLLLLRRASFLRLVSIDWLASITYSRH